MVLVTSATGHIGNIFVRQLLDRSEKVHALILSNDNHQSLEDLRVAVIEGKVLDLTLLFKPLRGIRGIFHLAGVISILPGRNFCRMKIPFCMTNFASLFTQVFYHLTRTKPRFTPCSPKELESDANISHAREIAELDYCPRPLYESFVDSIQWFLESKQLKYSDIANR